MMIPRENNAAPPVLQDKKDMTATCRLDSRPWAQSAVDGVGDCPRMQPSRKTS